LLPESRIRIAIAPAAAYQTRRSLFDMLSSVLAVDFEPHVPGGFAGLHGLIALPENQGVASEAASQGVSTLQICNSNRTPISAPSEISFTSSESVHGAFRNKSLRDPSLENFSRVPEASECLARTENQPIWSVERAGSHVHHYVGVDIPEFPAETFFYSCFRASRWFAMVPLLHFLRALLGPDGWLLPEPRATFIIDDPNLRSRRYGYIDFERLVDHASAHNYHATIATVPLDAWYFDRKIADLFRAQKQYLSLMMHGVNHIADELARGYTQEEALKLLATGLRRMAEFESRAELRVARIMAAPHGAFPESIAEPMLRLGFESACVSVGSLIRWNSEKHWPADLGFSFVQCLKTQGFPVFHRTSTKEIDIRLSAFLGHPVIIATHHQDFASNLGLIEKLANMVNEISAVRWMPAEKISRTNYLSRFDKGVLHVKLFTRRAEIPLPEGAVTLMLQSSPFSPETSIDFRKDSSGENGVWQYRISNNTLQIFFPPKESLDYKKVGSMRPGLWPITRRLLAETRDRVKPMLSFASTR
jgi:hypothetical protein